MTWRDYDGMTYTITTTVCTVFGILLFICFDSAAPFGLVGFKLVRPASPTWPCGVTGCSCGCKRAILKRRIGDVHSKTAWLASPHWLLRSIRSKRGGKLGRDRYRCWLKLLTLCIADRLDIFPGSGSFRHVLWLEAWQRSRGIIEGQNTCKSRSNSFYHPPQQTSQSEHRLPYRHHVFSKYYYAPAQRHTVNRDEHSYTVTNSIT